MLSTFSICEWPCSLNRRSFNLHVCLYVEDNTRQDSISRCKLSYSLFQSKCLFTYFFLNTDSLKNVSTFQSIFTCPPKLPSINPFLHDDSCITTMSIHLHKSTQWSLVQCINCNTSLYSITIKIDIFCCPK